MTFEKILIVGCGNMAGAMLEGWLAAGLPRENFTVVTPTRTSVPGDVELLREVPDGRVFDAVLLGFKPYMLADIALTLQGVVEGASVLSVLAGVQLETLRERFPDAGSVVRVMPNLACAIGKSPVALAEEGLGEAERDDLVAFIDHLGTPAWVGEDRFDLVTALAGSGPAFVYRFIDALAAGATRLGLPEDQARELAIAMTEGASALTARSEHPPGKLADMVASPGGVTRKGMDVLDEDEALTRLMTETLRAARDRSIEMSREARK
ncbi:pyrroline-5-carboxylate reductase family protein [Aurantiacibacter aquimixticola]|uniref:Pyrroline-5-carboxylate reductase n=1 Tax=Aurantiacibacter aquimixticola TaxID=1958945 RepID=A0A419RT65_9SPHN|nr:pyrroline-5-carboxylate reductase [Aurantiacibacter aquimixticola]RJY08993.1 pyrroline-5-carboxylate reductase [Aurantiacibacter aquimixticola]